MMYTFITNLYSIQGAIPLCNVIHCQPDGFCFESIIVFFIRRGFVSMNMNAMAHLFLIHN